MELCGNLETTTEKKITILAALCFFFFCIFGCHFCQILANENFKMAITLKKIIINILHLKLQQKNSLLVWTTKIIFPLRWFFFFKVYLRKVIGCQKKHTLMCICISFNLHRDSLLTYILMSCKKSFSFFFVVISAL